MKSINRFLFAFFFVMSAFFFISCDQITDPTISNSVDKSPNQELNKDFQTRPFTAPIIYKMVSQVNDSIFVYEGSGNVTHLGLTSVLDTTIHHFVFDEDFNMIGLTVEGIDVLTAANGDKVYLTWFMDYFDPSTWTYAINGGTGRFAGATGVGMFTAEYTASGDLAVTFKGNITY